MPKSAPLSELEIARETLRRLALNKLLPTPDNYRTVFHEISGLPAISIFPERELKALQAALPRENKEQIRFAHQLEAAIAEKNWDNLKAVLIDSVSQKGVDETRWPAVIRNLFQQLETPHVEMTDFQKKEALEHVLAVSSNPDLLLTRLLSLTRSWEKNTAAIPRQHMGLLSVTETASLVNDTVTVPAKKEKKSPDHSSWQGGIAELQALIVQLLDNTLTTVLRNNPELAGEANEISAAVKSAQNAESLIGLSERLKKLCYRTHFIAEDEAEANTALLHLVQLIMDNISELVVEDQWLTGQINMMRDLFLQPLDLRRLDEIERRMKDVIVKQSMLKKDLIAANDRLKLMLATFVDHLTNFSETTGDYHGNIEAYAEKISKAGDISELTVVLHEVMHETRLVQLDTARSRDELRLMQNRVQEAEQEVVRLQNELSTTSKMIRHDTLTGVLNRKGLDEALQKEIARQRRPGGALSLALLDIDNFKKINDTLGHAAGDAALVHLAKVVQETIRPQDTLARYGGEEFVVLLPNTNIDDAVSAMMRVQRELTRKFFMADNDKMLITFSCGVVESTNEEDPYAALSRADAAMYLAKRTGKNRVVPA